MLAPTSPYPTDPANAKPRWPTASTLGRLGQCTGRQLVLSGPFAGFTKDWLEARMRDGMALQHVPGFLGSPVQ